MNRQVIRYYWTALCLILGIAYMIGNTSVDYRINAQYTPTPDPNQCTCTYTCTGNCLALVSCRKIIDDSSCGITPNVSNLSCCNVPTGTTACNALRCFPTMGLGGCGVGGSGSMDDCGGVSCDACPGSSGSGSGSGGGGGGGGSQPTPTLVPGCVPNCANQACRASTCANTTCVGTCGEFCYGTLGSTSSSSPTLGTPTSGGVVPVGTTTLRWNTPTSWGTCPGTGSFVLCVSTSSSSPCTTGVKIPDLPTSQLSYDYTFSVPGTYYWTVGADNGTGLTVSYSPVNTLIVNQSPSLSGLTLFNSHNIQVPWDVGVGISGKSHIQNPIFSNDSSPRTVVFSFDLTDANGWSDIQSAQMSWNGQTNNLTLSNGSGTTVKGSATINYLDSDNSDITYPIRLSMVDSGGSTGWLDTGYYFKVWDGTVTVIGNMYDSSDSPLGAVVITGDGFTDLAPADMNFISVGVTDFSTGLGFTVPVTGAGSVGVVTGNLTGNLVGTSLTATVTGSVTGGSITGALTGTSISGSVVSGVLAGTISGTVVGNTLTGTVSGSVSGNNVTASVVGTLGSSTVSGTLTGTLSGGVLTGTVSATVVGSAIGGNSFSLTLDWGDNYLITPNSNLSGSNVVTRWTDVTNGTVNSGPQRIVDLSTVDPYSSNVDLKIDFSAIRNQSPWYQIYGAGLNAGGSIGNMVPVTCANNVGCYPAVTYELSSGEANNGLVSAPSLTNGSGCSLTDPASACKFGIPNNWYRTSSTVLAKDSYSYQYFYNKYYVGLGLGSVLAGGEKMSTVAGLGGTGVIFVDGDFTVDANNSLTVGKSLVLIVKGTVTFDAGVTSFAGIVMADGGVQIKGLGSQLTIDGILYSASNSGTIRLNRDLGGTNNNVGPGVKVVYRPDMLFSLPGPMLKVLSSWRTGQ